MKVSELTGALLDYWVAKHDPRCEGCGIAYLLDHELGPHYVGSTADGIAFFIPTAGVLQLMRLKRAYQHADAYRPHAEWAHGGPIIEREGIQISPPESMMHVLGGPNAGWQQTGVWHSTIFRRGAHRRTVQRHETSPLIAAMRAYVASKLGDEVPDDT
jgi:hypothetical protein